MLSVVILIACIIAVGTVCHVKSVRRGIFYGHLYKFRRIFVFLCGPGAYLHVFTAVLCKYVLVKRGYYTIVACSVSVSDVPHYTRIFVGRGNLKHLVCVVGKAHVLYDVIVKIRERPYVGAVTVEPILRGIRTVIMGGDRTEISAAHVSRSGSISFKGTGKYHIGDVNIFVSDS